MNDPEPIIAAYLDGVLSDTERAELNTWLKADAANLRRFTEAVMFEQQIRTAAHANAEQHAAADFDASVVDMKPRSRWLAWRPLAAAAAGLVIGLFCASVAWAYVAPSLGKAITLLQESFESGPAPLGTGVPVVVGVWSGDYSEIMGEQQGVRPASGGRMLRFLRGDYEGRSIPSSHSSDVFRLVDVRPFKREFADGGAVVQLSAVFNAVAFSEDENFSATLTLFALDASLVGNAMMKAENVLSTESLAFSRSSKVVMDRDPATWQRVSNELRLPPGTEFLMLRIGMSNDTKSKDKRRDSFAGHFADKVQLVVARRVEIPVP